MNLGGYDPDDFSELHKNVFVVAPTQSKAKVRALKEILHWPQRHEDYTFEVEKISAIDDAISGSGKYIHLVKTDNPKPFTFICKYRPIGKSRGTVKA